MQDHTGMTFLGRVLAALGISMVLTVFLLLIFQVDAPQASGEDREASGGSASPLSESAIRPVSLR